MCDPEMAGVSAMHGRVGAEAKGFRHPGTTRGGMRLLGTERRHAFRFEIHHGLWAADGIPSQPMVP